MKKKYWKSIQETQHPAGQQAATDGQEHQPASMMDVLASESNEKSSSRRDFLKWCGISFVSATVLAACENPVKKAIPYLNQPEVLTPGKASWYASTYIQGNEYCPVLVKSRDGRPIKIEGNELSSITRGGTSARVQASVLSLYDNGARYHHPQKNGSTISWDDADREIIQQLEIMAGNGRRVVLLTPTLLSPSTRALIEETQSAFPNLEVITWDAVSYSAIRKAHQDTFGTAIIPDYHFDKARLIVSFSADFLGTWLSPVAFSRDYAATRRVSQEQPTMSRHIQFESNLSLTGANADERVPVKPSDEVRILMDLYNAVARATGNPVMDTPATTYDTEALAAQILENRGQTLVVCGHNRPDLQILVNAINHMAGSYGNTITTNRSIQAGMGQEEAFENLVEEMHQGNVGAIMFYKCNPLYHYHNPDKFREAMERTDLTISFATTKDETAATCRFILPDHHYLESWNDAMFKTGLYSLAQPLIYPIFNSRQFQDTLLKWTGNDMDFHEYMKSWWQQNLFPAQGDINNFSGFWMNTLQAGVYETSAPNGISVSLQGGAIAPAIRSIHGQLPAADRLEFSLMPHLALADGADANNPWLQELPDPVSSVTWDNFAAMAPALARELGLREGERIRINEKLEVPVLIQPGQANNCISVALGYGRTHAGITGDNTGGNAFPLVQWSAGSRHFTGEVTQWEKTGNRQAFARTQTHFSMEGRAIVRETTLDKYRQDPAAGNELHAYHEKHMVTLYPEHKYEGHHWVLMVDLNACTGCSTCVISCQSENNTPVIGREEVRRRRIMHWMRIDRYYTGDSENPGVVFQPLMCQHCDHAPCENVCPVAATTHSVEGLNQMAYNRCVGTKYCINNCPYKVRRFNWFEYSTREKFNKHTTTELGRMVLNPDVTVRERGVVEKCSFCIQRIQEGKLKAKNERRQLRDGEVVPACASACPSNALVFGDLNNKESRVAELIKDPRNYHLLEELHTLPSVGYLTKVRNPIT
jgi:Fe-S-cluster-containing dehydrogenase component/anaerobic selenocysteine-containing dehydrogenase